MLINEFNNSFTSTEPMTSKKYALNDPKVNTKIVVSPPNSNMIARIGVNDAKMIAPCENTGTDALLTGFSFADVGTIVDCRVVWSDEFRLSLVYADFLLSIRKR